MTQPIEPDLVYPPAGRTSVVGGRTVIDLRGTNFGGDSSDQTIGDGSGSSSLKINKSAGGDADIFLQAASVNRARIRLDASENLLISRLNGSGVVQDTITYNNSTGLLSLPAGLTIAAGTLTVTGVTVVGLDTHITLELADLRGAQAQIYGFASPVAGVITKIKSRLRAALATGDATVTGKIGATTITDGALTIAQASAVGAVASCAPSALNVVTEDSNINFTVSGANTAQVSATITVTIRRSA